MVMRRFLMAALALAATALCVPVVEAQTPAGPPSARPALVLVCHDQSEACKTWRSQWQPLFAGSPAYKMIDIRTINAPTAKAMMQPAAWPADLRWLLDTFLMSQQGAWEEYETPRFFLLQNGSVTASTAGNNGWRDYMWPTILDVTNTKP
jgi:hypothetical protein